METMKKMIDADTHLMKSFKKNKWQEKSKQKHWKSVFIGIKWLLYSLNHFKIGTSPQLNIIYALYENCTHQKRPEEAFKSFIEFGGVGEQHEESSQELQQGDRHEACSRGRRETHERH